MYNITLICTVHKENGNCNSNELCKIIETINPEIIFEEIPYFMYIEQYKKFSENNLEIQAIKKYLEKHQVEQLPVDNLDLLKSLDEFDYRNEPRIRNNIVWHNLLDKQFSLECQHGFMYLNSNSCDDLFEKIYIQEEYIIKNINKEKLSHLFKSWHEIQNKREYEMINNIFNYKHTCNNALFLVGSGHRKSIIKKIQEYNGKEELNLKFDI
jgi:hypothetical protein